LAFDLGALMLAAYALGLPLGGGAKLKLAPAEEPAPKRAPVIVVKGASPPPAQAAPSSAHDAVEAAPPSPPSPPKKTAPARERTPASPARKQLPGARPQGLAQPRGGKPDDLTKIKGIGPKSAEKLHALGVWHYDQIAAWTPDNLEWIGSWLALPGRIDRGVWVTQAKNLASRAPQDGEQDEAKAD
jgi:predicted flap endonuclease-1-like 5' DNA nuclease